MYAQLQSLVPRARKHTHTHARTHARTHTHTHTHTSIESRRITILCSVFWCKTNARTRMFGAVARGMEACRNQRCADGLACLVDEELFNYHSCVNTQTTLKATNAPQSTPKRPASYDTRNRREVGNIKETTTEPVSTPEPRMRTDNWISLFIVLAFLVMGVALLLIAGLAKIRYMSLRWDSWCNH